MLLCGPLAERLPLLALALTSLAATLAAAVQLNPAWRMRRVLRCVRSPCARHAAPPPAASPSITMPAPPLLRAYAQAGVPASTLLVILALDHREVDENLGCIGGAFADRGRASEPKAWGAEAG
jgi:hypothetical protein